LKKGGAIFVPPFFFFGPSQNWPQTQLDDPAAGGP
jgi:hypothetical protein